MRTIFRDITEMIQERGRTTINRRLKIDVGVLAKSRSASTSFVVLLGKTGVGLRDGRSL
jgi:hypothetical protein